MPNPRAQKPLTLAQVKKDLLSFKEPATALADMIAGGFRGLAQGTFGLPGEIESLGRSAINLGLESAPKNKPYIDRGIKPPQISEESTLTNMKDAERHMTNMFGTVIPKDAPDQKSREQSVDYGRTFGQLGVLPGTTGAVKLATYGAGRGAGALTRAGAKAINDANLYGKGPLAAVTPQVQNIVKSGGGNWLRQGLDEQRLLGDAGNGRAQTIWNRQQPDYQAQYPERQQLAVANDTVADWANKNMRKYMANQMGTDKDPVRLLAEENISHFGMRPDEFGEYPYIKPSEETKRLRKKHTERTGEESPVGESSLAAYWENLSDNAIKATTVGDIKNAPKAGYSFKAKEDIAPYADKVDPETPIYNIDNGTMEPRTVRQTLGFNRLLEVMREDIAAGRVTPEEVSKWDMEQAVRHVDKRDKAIWKAEADEADRLAKEFARYFPTLKEYPDKSRWIELKVPEIKELPEGAKWEEYGGNWRLFGADGESLAIGPTKEKALQEWGTKKLEEALAHEGEKMGHCVGSYCEDVITGKSRVISYRDANGDSHVTLEVTPPSIDDFANANQSTPYKPAQDKIMQIKGKGDAAPVGRYQPYVQDFQRMTKYPIEGDFVNSGFDFPATGPRGIFDEDQVKTLREAGHDVPDYLTKAEREDLVRKLYERETGNDFDTGNPLNPPEPPTEGMKAGGAVHISDNPDTMAMELQNRRYQAGGVVRGLKALKGALRNPEALVPSTRGATKFAEPAPKTMSIMKEKGGNWLGGNIAGSVDQRLRMLKTPTVAGETPAQRIPKHEALLSDPTLNQDQIDRVLYQLEQTKGEAALDKWIESNVGNYVKKEMGTPEDPVRLMLEKRAQEIEAQFQVDMNRAQRTRAKAEAETDPDKRANLMRRADQQEVQAKADRDFANEHATHLPRDERFDDVDDEGIKYLKEQRQMAGFDPEGMAKSEPAQRWENISDDAISITRAGDIQKQQAMAAQAKEANLAFDKLFNEIDERYSVEFRKELERRGVTFDDQQFMNIIKSTPITDKANYLGLGDQFKKLRQESFNADKMFSSGLQEIGEENPFVAKLDPETKLYQAYLGDLGIDHVIDVIRQDVAAGRIRPEQLNKLTMDQAIKRTAEYNKELIQKINSERAAAREGLPLYKEYPEGYRWVELNKPGSFNAESEAMGHSVKGYEPPKGHPDWTENSGDYGSLSYGHGGWEGIKSGRAKVYSLVDSKGSPHVTVEVGKPQVRTEPEEMQKIYDQAVQEANERGLNSNEEFNAFYFDRVKQLQNDLIDRKQANASNVITQIKGKGNQKPVEDYIPFVQDFVRSGKWSDVKDMHHTDLHKLGSEYLTSSEAEAKYKPKIQEALNFLETHPLFEEHRLAQKADDAYRGDVFGPEYDELNRAAGRSITPNVPYTYRELKALLTSPEDWTDRGETIYTPISRALEKISEARKELGIVDEPPVEGMKAGGKVHVSNNPDAMRMELDNKKFAMGGAVMNPSDVGSPSPQNSASPVPSFQAGGAVKGLAAVKQALTGGKKAATAVKPSLVIKSEPSLIVSNLIDEEPNIAKRLGAEARAKRQKAIEAEGKRQEAARQTQPSVGYRQSTEKNPDPLVGTRFVNEPAFGLNPNDPFDITKYKGGSGMVLPWDSQSRNVKTTQLSGVDLPNQVFDVTHGGIPYAFDTQHVAKGIAGASGEDISKRIKTRADTAVRENKDRGGTGELLHFPITMGYRAEDYALPYSEFSFDIINHKLMTGELTKREADELSEMVRKFSPPKYKGKKPFAEFAGFTEPKGLNQIYTGEGLKVPSGELRKAIADRIIWQKGSQEKLGFNAEDLMNATTYEPLRGVDKGFIGSTVMRNTPTGMRLSPSAGKYPYDTDFSGEHLGRLDDLVDVEALFHRTLNPIKHELITRENLKPYNKESLRNAAIGAIEKRNEGIAQPIDQQFLEDYNDYINELKKPHEYQVGGSVKAKKKYSDGGAISALMKHAETAGQSARMNNQRM